MSMENWDKYTAPVLRAMESNAKWLEYHARGISEAVMLLPARPDFETKAEAELKQVEADLLIAIDRVQSALKCYGHKPVDGVKHLEAAE